MRASSSEESNFLKKLYKIAKQKKKTIVLPESDDLRVLQAANKILAMDLANIVLIGEENEIKHNSQNNNLNLSKASFISQSDSRMLENAAKAFYEIRKSKGITQEQAFDKMSDISYFSTMLVHLGKADGMVSGAVHSTAQTIVPSFQIIKTKPETSIVSSAFFMLLADGVKVFADCAVNPNPNARQLADIAVSTYKTAKNFSIEPKIAMLSYSTLGSGSGPDVDLVIEASKLAKQELGEQTIDGPLQYDAAVSRDVAKIKAKNSPVAGKANVFIFPDLQSGNIAYKAVQRATSSIAIGPLLQGLNKPVNDLSRGASAEDIANTIVLTAVQSIFDSKA
ncbi:MAG: phosphate acetyltransferase [Bifidobacteriaceae bacterium]|jgi:phosphate acetyltransferase|nr:phosphate acetyltransferase [Bifidobacteriaceae bacterium]